MSVISLVKIEKCQVDDEIKLDFYAVFILANGKSGLVCNTSRLDHAELIKASLEYFRDSGYPIHEALTPGRNVKTLI